MTSVSEFERRYKCKIRESDRYENTYTSDYAQYTYDVGMNPTPYYYTKRTPYYDIEINKEGLQRLQDDLQQFDRYRHEASSIYAEIASLRKRSTEESAKRDRNPAAAKAYEKYLLLLNMTADNNGRS